MNSARGRVYGALAIVGGALWAVAWAFGLHTEEGPVLGLAERGWRRLLDPALLFLILAFFAYRRRYVWPGSRAATVGWAIATLGLLTTLAGNVIEFWIGDLLYTDVPGQFEPSDHVGWALFLSGALILVPAGLILLGVAHFGAQIVFGWRRLLPLLMGTLSVVLSVVLAALAGAETVLNTVPFVFAAGWMLLGYDLWSAAGASPDSLPPSRSLAGRDT
jgi:hypothetical protein